MTYLQTQVTLITSDRVLEPAVANTEVATLPTIKKSEDPKSDLRKNLLVEIVKDANLIRVALESPNPQEAVTIVNAVVESYLAQNIDYSRTANRDLTNSLEQQIKKLGTEINAKKKELKELVKKGKVAALKPREMLNTKTETDPTQPTFKVLPEAQIQQIVSEMVKTDLELFDAKAHA